VHMDNNILTLAPRSSPRTPTVRPRPPTSHPSGTNPDTSLRTLHEGQPSRGVAQVRPALVSGPLGDTR